MRKSIYLIVFILLFVSGNQKANAQYYLTDDGVEIPYLFLKGTHVYDEHRAISDMQLGLLLKNVEGIDYSVRFMKARKAYKAGVGLTVTGGIIGVAGGAYRYFTGDQIGTYVALGGLALTIIGVPTFCVNRSRMHTFINRYNSMNTRRLYSFTAGPQTYGYGIALKF